MYTKDYMRLYNECIEELRAIRIVPGFVRKFVIGDLPNYCNGICQRYTDDTYEIHLSPVLDDERVSDNVVKSVIIHELLHTLPDCMDHDKNGKWEWLAECVMEKYPQYNLRAYSRSAIFDLEQ